MADHISFPQLLRNSGIAPTQYNQHVVGDGLQYVIDENIEAARKASVDPGCCWACHDVDSECSSGSIAFQSRHHDPDCVIEITCPVCNGTGIDEDEQTA